jgi:hypothetical protein
MFLNHAPLESIVVIKPSTPTLVRYESLHIDVHKAKAIKQDSLFDNLFDSARLHMYIFVLACASLSFAHLLRDVSASGLPVCLRNSASHSSFYPHARRFIQMSMRQPFYNFFSSFEPYVSPTYIKRALPSRPCSLVASLYAFSLS